MPDTIDATAEVRFDRAYPWVVKSLRQKAAMLMATDPRMAPIAAEIRARTQKMLRGGAAYEGARH